MVSELSKAVDVLGLARIKHTYVVEEVRVGNSVLHAHELLLALRLLLRVQLWLLMLG